jgi:hypothetical protein
LISSFWRMFVPPALAPMMTAPDPPLGLPRSVPRRFAHASSAGPVAVPRVAPFAIVTAFAWIWAVWSAIVEASIHTSVAGPVSTAAPPPVRFRSS